MKFKTVRNLAFAGTMAGLLIGSSGTLKYLDYKLEKMESHPISRLEQIEDTLYEQGLQHSTIPLIVEKTKILSDPNIEEMRLDYDSKNRDAAWGALYFILGGGTLSLGSLGSFMRYNRKRLENERKN